MRKSEYNVKLAEDTAKRFRMLCEYSFNITEDDDEIENIENEGDSENTEEPAIENGDNETPQNNDTIPQSDVDNNQEGGAPGFNPEENIDLDNGEEMPNDVEPMQNDDEVIDVDDLTQSQEETEEKVDNIHVTMEKGFDKLLSVVDKLNKMIDNSTQNMEKIKQEIEKRNPTPLEKLNMRAANDSYPFNVSPKEYWKEKEATSNYRIGDDGNDGYDNKDKEYVITQGDIDNISDFRAISKDLNDSEFNQNLLNIFGLR